MGEITIRQPQGNLKLTRSSPVARTNCCYRTIRFIDGRHSESVRFSALIDAFALVTLDDIRDEPFQFPLGQFPVTALERSRQAGDRRVS